MYRPVIYVVCDCNVGAVVSNIIIPVVSAVIFQRASLNLM